MKNNKLLESLALTQLLTTITQKKFCVKVGTLLYDISLPLISFTILINVIILVAWFVFWSIPEHFYIPFMGGKLQDFFDRGMVLIGVLMRIFNKRLYK